MTLNNIKQLRKDRGFTIVELLIVIIVIAILAAIVIVAYQGITQKANTSKAQTNAVSVQKKVEAFNADNTQGNGQYPAAATNVNSATGVAAPVQGVTVQGSGSATAAPTNLSASNATSTVDYASCTAGGQVVGYYIAYYDQSAKAITYIVGGSQIAAGATATTFPTITGCTISTT